MLLTQRHSCVLAERSPDRQSVAQAALLPRELQHLLHHGPDAVVDVVERRLAHEGRGRDHLVFLVYMSFVRRC